MTKQELNRDIKRLVANLLQKSKLSDSEYYAWINGEAKKEFIRLYDADPEMKCMNVYSVKAMLRINVRHRFIQFHQFGLQIDIKIYQ